MQVTASDITFLDSPVLDERDHSLVMNGLKSFGPIPLKHIIRHDSTTLDNYFSAEATYGREVRLAGTEALWEHRALCEAARALYGLRVLEPRSTSIHLMGRDDTGGPHTDAPHFAGCRDLDQFPATLRMLIHHSGAFNHLRARVATGVLWLHDPLDHGFRMWPEGPDQPSIHVATHSNSGVVFDADTMVHAIDRPRVAARPRWPVLPGIVLRSTDDGWQAWHRRRQIAAFADHDLRVSLIWKMYCFESEVARDAYFGAAPLDPAPVIDRLVAIARERSELPASLPPWPDCMPALERALLPSSQIEHPTKEHQ